MYEQMIKLTTIKDVYYLAENFRTIDCDLDIMTAHRKHVVDAKSVLGILSLDLSQPVILKAYTTDAAIVAKIKKVLIGLGRQEMPQNG